MVLQDPCPQGTKSVLVNGIRDEGTNNRFNIGS